MIVFVLKGPRSQRHGLTGLPDNNGNFLMGSKVCCALVPGTCCGKTRKSENSLRILEGKMIIFVKNL